MRENAFCMVFHARWISHHSSSNPTLVATRLRRDSETRGEKNQSDMENHTKCISYRSFTRLLNNVSDHPDIYQLQYFSILCFTRFCVYTHH